MPIYMAFLLYKDPELLARRLQRSEERSNQKIYVLVSDLILLAIILIPGFEKRFGWRPSIPGWLAILANFTVIAGYIVFMRVLRENSYAARTVRVESGTQKVITTGPYAIIRHPMYFAVIIMFGASPIALGSFWGIFPLFLLGPLLILRVKDEEKLLAAELEGYSEYMQQTKYRIFPGIW